MQHRRARLIAFIGSLIVALMSGTLVGAPAQSAPQWEALPGLNDDAADILFAPDGTLYAGGDFTGGVKRWDGTQWQLVGSGTSIGNVNALAMDGSGNLYAAGASSPYVQVWDGDSWDPLSGGDAPSAGVRTLLFSAGALYAGGGGFSGGAFVARWNGSTWVGLTAGTGPSSTINALAAWSGGELLAGGGDNSVFVWSGSPSPSWSQLGASLGAEVYSITVGAGDVTYAGRSFAPFVSRWDGSAWVPTSPELTKPDGFSARMYALLAGSDGTLYAGGFYNLEGGGQALSWMGVLASAAWTSPGTAFFDDRIFDFELAADGTLYASGDFTGNVARLIDSGSTNGGSSGPPPATETLSLDAGQGVTCRLTSATGRKGAWITLPGSSDCTAPSDAPNATLLGWATTPDFSVTIARRQVNNRWGAYETFDDTGRLTAVFVPAGGSTFLSGSERLYAVWDG